MLVGEKMQIMLLHARTHALYNAFQRFRIWNVTIFYDIQIIQQYNLFSSWNNNHIPISIKKSSLSNLNTCLSQV